MKKLLSILGSAGLLLASGLNSTISCGYPDSHEKNQQLVPLQRVLDFELHLNENTKVSSLLDDIEKIYGGPSFLYYSPNMYTNSEYMYISDPVFKLSSGVKNNLNKNEWTSKLGFVLQYKIYSFGYNDKYGSYDVETPVYYDWSDDEIDDINNINLESFAENNSNLSINDMQNRLNIFLKDRKFYKNIKEALVLNDNEKFINLDTYIYDWVDVDNSSSLVGTYLSPVVKGDYLEKYIIKKIAINRFAIRFNGLFMSNDFDFTNKINENENFKINHIDPKGWNDFNIFDSEFNLYDLIFEKNEEGMNESIDNFVSFVSNNKFLNEQKKYFRYLDNTKDIFNNFDIFLNFGEVSFRFNWLDNSSHDSLTQWNNFIDAFYNGSKTLTFSLDFNSKERDPKKIYVIQSSDIKSIKFKVKI